MTESHLFHTTKATNTRILNVLTERAFQSSSCGSCINIVQPNWHVIYNILYIPWSAKKSIPWVQLVPSDACYLVFMTVINLILRFLNQENLFYLTHFLSAANCILIMDGSTINKGNNPSFERMEFITLRTLFDARNNLIYVTIVTHDRRPQEYSSLIIIL